MLDEYNRKLTPWPEELRVPEGSLFDELPHAAGGNVRFAFVGGPMHYVDPRGEFECLSGGPCNEAQWPLLAEECGRITAMVNSPLWGTAAILVTHRLLEAAQRQGRTSAWAYALFRVSGGFRELVKDHTGRYPEKAPPDSFVREKPHRGRWLYDKGFGLYPTVFAIHCLRGHNVLKVTDPPSVAIWGWPDGSDMMLQAFCDTLSPPDAEPVTIVLPDTPRLYDFALRYSAKKQMTQTDRTLAENSLLFLRDKSLLPDNWQGEVCSARFRLTRIVEPSGDKLDGDLAVAALDFLDANYQVRISPWDLVQDSLLRQELVPRAAELRRVRASLARPTPDEQMKLEKSRERYRWNWKNPAPWLRFFGVHRPGPLGQP